MKKKNYKGTACTKRTMEKGKGIIKTYNRLEYVFADLLSEDPEVEEFQTCFPLDGCEEGEYASDFFGRKVDGSYFVRECVYWKHIFKPMTGKLLDISRNYWLRRGVTDWGIIMDKRKNK